MHKSTELRIFDKKYDFTNTSAYRIPTQAYKSLDWSLSNFQKDKIELNGVKSRLDNFNLNEWSQFTRNRDPASYIIQSVKKKFGAELVTQAWCKFYECLCNFEIINVEGAFRSLHLCEAPGAFISALNHYLASNDHNVAWDWRANSLNPYYEGNALTNMIPDDRLLKDTYSKWCWGADFTGDITVYKNYLHLVETTTEKVIILFEIMPEFEFLVMWF